MDECIVPLHILGKLGGGGGEAIAMPFPHCSSLLQKGHVYGCKLRQHVLILAIDINNGIKVVTHDSMSNTFVVLVKY